MNKIDVKKVVMGDVGVSINVDVNENIQDVELPEDLSIKNVTGKIKVIRLEETLFVTGNLQGLVELKCDRCLETFSKNVDFTIEREFEIDRKKESEENLFVDKYLMLDITDPVREELLMAIPMKNICKEECLGIQYN